MLPAERAQSMHFGTVSHVYESPDHWIEIRQRYSTATRLSLVLGGDSLRFCCLCGLYE